MTLIKKVRAQGKRYSMKHNKNNLQSMRTRSYASNDNRSSMIGDADGANGDGDNDGNESHLTWNTDDIAEER